MATRSKNIDHALDYGKIPPQALDMEEAVLGAVMLEKNAIYAVGSFLTSTMFYRDAHQKIYQAIIDLQIKSHEIDILTVTEQLRKNDQLDLIGGPYYITQLASKVSSAAHIEEHARIIEQKFLQREIIRITTEYQDLSYDDTLDVNDIIDSLSLNVMKLKSNIIEQSQHIRKAVNKSLDHLYDLVSGKSKPYGLRTRLTAFDKSTNGIQKGVTIIAARPGMGKTSLALQMINNITVDQKIPGAFFSLEMFEEQLIRWLQSQRSKIQNKRIKLGRLENFEIEKIEHDSAKIADAPLYVDYTPAINIIQLRSKAIQLKNMYNIEYIVIDYLQLMGNVDTGRTQNREQEVAQISRGLLELSKELDIPIIALAQLNRALLNRGDKRPNLSDLRESGAIEQDANMVIFIHRPEKYGIIEYEDGESTEGIAELIFAKNRDGDNDINRLGFDGSILSFFNLENINPNEFIESSNNKDEIPC